jgi:hypothetical protein
MNHKIAESVCGNTTGDKKQVIESALNTKIKQHYAWNRKNDKKDIVAFKSMFVFRLMMICMKIPHQAVHDIFMRKPGNTFHE